MVLSFWGWESKSTPILETLVRKNQGFFMPKNLEQEWRVVPKCRETPILETLVSKNQGKFMPKIFETNRSAVFAILRMFNATFTQFYTHQFLS